MQRDPALFKKTIDNLPDGLCEFCRGQFDAIDLNFDLYKYDADREMYTAFAIHTECLTLILQHIKTAMDSVETVVRICETAFESKRICGDCHAEIAQKRAALKAKPHSALDTKMIFMHASCLVGLSAYLVEV